MLHGYLQKRLASRLDEYFELPEGILDERGIYVTRLDKHSPIWFQILEDVLGEASETKKTMLELNSDNVYCVGSNPEGVPFERVTVTSWHRRLTAEEEREVTSRQAFLDSVYRLRREENETSPRAAQRLLLNYRAAIVELLCSWYSEANCFRRFMDAQKLQEPPLGFHCYDSWTSLPAKDATLDPLEFSEICRREGRKQANPR